MWVLKRVQIERGYNNYLRNFASNVTSQTGEDGIIEKIFSIIPATTRCCAEFGAWDGKEFSNTWNLIHNRNWRAVLIEADQDRYAELVDNNRGRQDVLCLNKKVDLEGPDCLDNILAGTDIPVEFDLLSIDIDGNDYYVWESLVNYRPKLVIIEFNLTIPNDIVFIQDKDMSVNQGCSLSALIELGKAKGYELIAVTEINGFFIQEKYLSFFDIPDNRIDCMFDQSKYETKIFQLFDGTLVLEGLKKLLWHGNEITDEGIQVLAPHERVYPDRVREGIKQSTRKRSFISLCRGMFSRSFVKKLWIYKR